MSVLIEIKGYLKRHSVAFLLVGLLLLMIITIQSFQNQDQQGKLSWKFFNHMLLGGTRNLTNNIDFEDLQQIPQRLEDYADAVNYQHYLAKEILQYDPEKDYQMVNFYMMHTYLFNWFVTTELSEEWHALSDDEKLISPREHFGEAWQEVREKMNFPEIGEFYYLNLGIFNSESFAISTLFYQELYEQNIMRQNSISTRPWSFTYLLFSTSVPMVFTVFALLMGAQIISSQRETGVIKNQLSAVKSRLSFLSRSYVMAIGTSILVCFFVLLLFFLMQGARYGFSDQRHPVIIRENQLTHWSPDYTIVEAGKNFGNVDTIGLVNHISSREPEHVFEQNISLPLFKAVPLVLLFLGLYMALWCSVGLCASIYIKNGVAARGCAILVFMASLLPKVINPNLSNTMWDMMGFFNLTEILSGYHPVTLPQILVVNIVCSIAIGILSYVGFRRQDITV